MLTILKRLAFFCGICWLLIQFTACTTSKQMVYMYNLKDSAALSLAATQDSFALPIQKNDQLWITVGGSNPEDLAAINSGMGVVQGSTANITTQVMGYMVEADGTIKLPYLGHVKAAGLSRLQLENQLTEQFKAYTKNPVVNVRFLNYKVTVLGEVQNPGSFNVPGERITILEALGMAGDLTVMGKRNSVLVIREVNGQRTFGRVNLLSKDLFHSPYYFLQTHDVVYVEPAPAKFLARERLPTFVTVAASSLSLLLTLITISKK